MELQTTTGESTARAYGGGDNAEVSKVHQEVITLLSRMTQWSSHQERHKSDLAEHLKRAKEKEAETIDELDFLNLQKEILIEDTTKVTEQEYEQMMLTEQEQYQKEIDAIMKAEGIRLEEIENLEIELTHLAFLAVELEEYEKEYHRQQEEHKQSLKELRTDSIASAQKLAIIQQGIGVTVSDVAAAMYGQRRGDSKLSAAELRIKELERALALKNTELDQTKKQLDSSREQLRTLQQWQ